MEWITLLQAAFLGLVEGLTEFIPVSSTGHLILLIDILGFNAPPGKVFEVVIQFGSILAVCVLFRKKLWHVTRHLADDDGAQHFVFCLVVAFLPAMILGVMFHSLIKELLFSPKVVSIMLIVGGFVMIWVEKRLHRPRLLSIEAIPYRTALWIGLAQALAMVPGVSRSGATIIGALALGVDRKTAAEFSFFLAIPTMLAATVYDTYKNWESFNGDNLAVIITGFIMAFLSALVVVKALVSFVSRRGFVPFAIYRIILGSIMLILLSY